jgi:hypothetical protein
MFTLCTEEKAHIIQEIAPSLTGYDIVKSLRMVDACGNVPQVLKRPIQALLLTTFGRDYFTYPAAETPPFVFTDHLRDGTASLLLWIVLLPSKMETYKNPKDFILRIINGKGTFMGDGYGCRTNTIDKPCYCFFGHVEELEWSTVDPDELLVRDPGPGPWGTRTEPNTDLSSIWVPPAYQSRFDPDDVFGYPTPVTQPVFKVPAGQELVSFISGQPHFERIKEPGAPNTRCYEPPKARFQAPRLFSPSPEMTDLQQLTSELAIGHDYGNGPGSTIGMTTGSDGTRGRYGMGAEVHMPRRRKRTWVDIFTRR